MSYHTCHHTCLVICAAVSDTLRSALTVSESLLKNYSDFTHCRSCQQDSDCHPPHQHHTHRVLLTIILATRALTILLFDIVLAIGCWLSYTSHSTMSQLSAVSDKLRATITMSQNSSTYSSHLTHSHAHCQCHARLPAHRYHSRRVLLRVPHQKSS